MPAVMGQPVTVVQKPSTTPGVVLFEINRSLTGMGHERYSAGDEIAGERPPDELARRLFDHGGVDGIHVNSNVITIHTSGGSIDERALQALIEELFIYYGPGVEPPPFDEPGDDAGADGDAGSEDAA